MGDRALGGQHGRAPRSGVPERGGYRGGTHRARTGSARGTGSPSRTRSGAGPAADAAGAGQVERAPEWMQRAGVEWVHRMTQDPKRLVRRYLIDDLPFAAWLFADALRARFRR